MFIYWSGLIGLLLIAAVIILFSIKDVQKKISWQSWVFTTIFIMSALNLYFYLGDFNGLKQYYFLSQNKTTIQAELKKFKTVEQLIARMQQILKERPDDARGWFLLGRLNFATGRYQQARNCFERAYELDPNHENIKFELVQASFFADAKRLTPYAKKMLDQILSQDPKNPAALNLLALDAYHQRNYQKAAQIWEQILAGVDPLSKTAQELLLSISQAQKLSHTALHTIEAAIEIASKLKLPSAYYVLIYAKSENLPYPIAMVRLKQPSFPLTVHLSDKTAMLPNFRLSQFNSVRVFVRISRTGNALKRAGDLEGQTNLLTLTSGMNYCKLTIK